MAHSNRLLVCIALIVAVTGCPHAFGKGGTLGRAALKDLYDRARGNRCTLSFDDWHRLCGDPDYDEDGACPKECEPEDWRR